MPVGVAEPPAPRLAAPDAQLAAWLLLALVNTLVIVATLESAPLAIALTHHALDAGQMLAAGLVVRVLVAGWQRLGGHHRGRGSVALLSVAFMVDMLVLRADLLPRASKLAGSGSASAWLLVMLLTAATSIVVAAWAGAAARRRLFRGLAIVAALQLVIANHLLFVRNYPGVHLHVVLVSATFIGSSLTGLALPTRWRPPRWLRHIALLLASLLAAASLVVQPSSSVLVRMFARPGTALAPFVSRAHAYVRATRESADYPRAEERPAVPPSTPRWIDGDPVVILVTLDALRADVLHDRREDGRLPTLARLRDQGIFFENVRTPAPATMVALASIFSGRYFSQLHWSEYKADWQAFPHADESPRLPALLGEAGVATATFHGSEWMQPESGVVGQFAEHRFIPPAEARVGSAFTSASRLNDAAIEHLEQHGDRKLFVYMHWLEAHAPYDLGSSTGDPFEDYLSELELVDAELHRLVEAIDGEGLRDRAVLIVSSDHGEAFGEHHTQFHGVTVYEEMVRVPLVVWRPSGAPPGVVAEPVTLVDLAPTVLDLMGAETPGTMMGHSLVPLFRDTKTTIESRPIALDTGRHQQGIVFRDGYKIIRDRRLGTIELYDLRVDPSETNNLVDALPTEAEQKLDVLERFFGAHRLRRPGYEAPFRPP